MNILELSEQEGYNNIVKDLEEIKNKYISGSSDFDTQKMLIRNYGNCEIKFDNIEVKPDLVEISSGHKIPHETTSGNNEDIDRKSVV